MVDHGLQATSFAAEVECGETEKMGKAKKKSGKAESQKLGSIVHERSEENNRQSD